LPHPNHRRYDFEKAAFPRRELGIDALKVTLPDNFGYPAFRPQVLGLHA
jgi:hypothetical protein